MLTSVVIRRSSPSEKNAMARYPICPSKISDRYYCLEQGSGIGFQ
jgi:hypothetical protein